MLNKNLLEMLEVSGVGTPITWSAVEHGTEITRLGLEGGQQRTLSHERVDIVLFGMRHLGHETIFSADNSSQQIGLPSRDGEFRQSNSFLGELGVHSNEW